MATSSRSSAAPWWRPAMICPRIAPLSWSSSISRKAERTREACPALFCVRSQNPAGPNGSQPSSPSPKAPSGIATANLAAQAEKHRKAERQQAAAGLEHARGDLADRPWK